MDGAPAGPGNVVSSIKRFLSAITVEPVTFLMMLAVSLEYSMVQAMLFTRLCLEVTASNSSTANDPSLCLRGAASDHIQREVSRLEAIQMRYYLGILYGLSLPAIMYTGAWADRFGRRRPMFIPPSFSIFAQLIFIAFSLGLTTFPVWVLFLAAAVSGISGSFNSFGASAFGYIADITTSENRTKRIAILESMLFVA